MSEDQKCDLDLSHAWDALVAAGARVYLWCEQGVSNGTEVVFLGPDHAITADDQDGYKVIERDVYDESWELTPKDGYDDEAAIRAASDIEGFFGVVGLPGGRDHDYRWCETEEEAGRWIEEAHPTATEFGVLAASGAFDAEYRDGNKVYFRPKQVGPGYEPKVDR